MTAVEKSLMKLEALRKLLLKQEDRNLLLDTDGEYLSDEYNFSSRNKYNYIDYIKYIKNHNIKIDTCNLITGKQVKRDVKSGYCMTNRFSNKEKKHLLKDSRNYEIFDSDSYLVLSVDGVIDRLDMIVGFRNERLKRILKN